MRPQQVRMDLRDAVGAVRADDREVRHADVLVAALVDQAHARDPRIVAGEARAHLVEEPPVDLEDDLEVARQQQRGTFQRPLLQRLGEQRVIRIRERLLRHVPCVVPTEMLHVEQDAHELRRPRATGECR